MNIDKDGGLNMVVQVLVRVESGVEWLLKVVEVVMKMVMMW